MRINQQIHHLQPSPIRAFNDAISHIEDLIPLTIGEPDFNTPDFIKDAAIDAITHNHNGYSHSRGMIELRQAVAQYLNRRYQLSYQPTTDIIITAGPTQALFSSFLTLLNAGDKVIFASPHYVIYPTQIRLAHAIPVAVDVSQSGFILTPELLEETIQAHPETRVLLLNHPTNPTGVTYTKEQLLALIPVIEKYDLWVVSDEIYSELSYDTEHTSMATLCPSRTILINGLSKSLAMAGWRSGFIAGPTEIMNHLFKIHQATINTPNRQMQYASIAAYNDGDQAIEQMRQTYLARRNYLITAFESLGITTLRPQGAFYLFVKVPDWFNGNDVEFCTLLAHHAKVGVVPGSSFGPAGANYFRISYAASLETLQTAMTRISQWIQSLDH